MTDKEKLTFLGNIYIRTKVFGEKKRMVDSLNFEKPSSATRGMWYLNRFDGLFANRLQAVADYFGEPLEAMFEPVPDKVMDLLIEKNIAHKERNERWNEEQKILNNGGMLPRRMSETQKQWEKCKRGAMSLCFFCDNTSQYKCELFRKDGKPPKDAKYILSYEVTYDGETMLPRYMVTECKNWVKDKHIKEELL